LLLRLSSVVPIWGAYHWKAAMAGEILYFLHRHFRTLLVLGSIVILGFLAVVAKAALGSAHPGA